mmetsp:Transcript_10702/g.25504  ORF Transcript_10702/g.25504 Transcript_10702/m.25504 type:complete len:300 (+) Transcript_10702:170-1069(+)
MYRTQYSLQNGILPAKAHSERLDTVTSGTATSGMPMSDARTNVPSTTSASQAAQATAVINGEVRFKVSAIECIARPSASHCRCISASCSPSSLRVSVLAPTMTLSRARHCACSSCTSEEAAFTASSSVALHRVCCLLTFSTRSCSCWFCSALLLASDSIRCCWTLPALHCFSMACAHCNSRALACSILAACALSCFSAWVRREHTSESSACSDERASCPAAPTRSCRSARWLVASSRPPRRACSSSSSCARSCTASSCSRCCALLPLAVSCASSVRSLWNDSSLCSTAAAFDCQKPRPP